MNLPMTIEDYKIYRPVIWILKEQSSKQTQKADTGTNTNDAYILWRLIC